MADSTQEADTVGLTVSHQGSKHGFTLPATHSLQDLAHRISETLGIPPENQKLLISPKPGLLRPPFPSDLPLQDVAARKITLLGSTPAQIASLNQQISTSQAQMNRKPGPIKAATPARRRDFKSMHDSATYTFMQIRPLPYLPNPERSRVFLQRLADDAGIQSVMAKHKFRVGLLTEMNPAEHTTQESRTLGLNRNAGEVIELRLRTDAYDGYRDYKTIRRTLCHELTHNVHGEHDRNFWDLCKQIEKEVDRADWRSGGHQLGEDVYDPEDHFVPDEAAWKGGEFVLGAGPAATSSGGSASGDQTLSRREILAKAAEERMRREREARQGPGPS